MPNRIIKAATSEGRSPEGLVTRELIDFHLDFVRGGVGMTTIAYCCVSPEGKSAPGQIVMDRRAEAGLGELADAVHAEGALVCAQLGHAGPVATKQITGATPVAPSRMINPTSFQYCRAITRSEIARVVAQFADAAQVAVESGIDAVELHFGHNYLPAHSSVLCSTVVAMTTGEASITDPVSFGRLPRLSASVWAIRSL